MQHVYVSLSIILPAAYIIFEMVIVRLSTYIMKDTVGYCQFYAPSLSVTAFAWFAFQCATEAIFTLDLLCSLDPTLIQKLFPAIKTFHSEVTEGTTNYPRAVLAALQFFINYGEYACHVLLLG